MEYVINLSKLLMPPAGRKLRTDHWICHVEATYVLQNVIFVDCGESQTGLGSREKWVQNVTQADPCPKCFKLNHTMEK